MMRTRLRDRPADDLAWCPPADQKPPNLDRCAIDACLDNPLSDSEWNLLEINGYIGSSGKFDNAISEYATAYADQVEKDFEAFRSATRSGRFPTETSGSEAETAVR